MASFRDFVPRRWQLLWAERVLPWAPRLRDVLLAAARKFDDAGHLLAQATAGSIFGSVGEMRLDGEQRSDEEAATTGASELGAMLPRSERNKIPSEPESLFPAEEDVEDTLTRLMSDFRLESTSLLPRHSPITAARTQEPLASGGPEVRPLPQAAERGLPSGSKPSEVPPMAVAGSSGQTQRSPAGPTAPEPPLRFRRPRPSSIEESLAREAHKPNASGPSDSVTRPRFRNPTEPSCAAAPEGIADQGLKTPATPLPGQHLEQSFERLLSEFATPAAKSSSSVEPRVELSPAEPMPAPAETPALATAAAKQTPQACPSSPPPEATDSNAAPQSEEKSTRTQASELSTVPNLKEHANVTKLKTVVDQPVASSSEDPFVSDLIRQLNQIQLPVARSNARSSPRRAPSLAASAHSNNQG